MCRSRRSTAPSAARRSRRRRWSRRPRACSTRYGADAWYERPTEEFIPDGLTCPTCGGTSFEREMNILDVWFDSGSSHEAVLSVRPGAHVAGRHLSRGQRPASRLVPELAAGRPRHARAPAVPAGPHQRLRRRRERQEDVEVARQLDGAGRHHQAERRRHPAAVGGDERLHAGHPDQQGDPRARRRGVPQAAQHAALPARRTCTTSIRRPTWCRSRKLEEVDRYILARYGEVARQILRDYEEYQYGADLAGAARSSRRSI